MNIKHQQPTKYIKHLADNANFKAVTFNVNCNGLTGLLSEMPNVSYTWPLAASEKNETATLKPDYKIEKTDRKY